MVGAGLFGTLVALSMAKKGHEVSILESHNAILQNASAVNQARLHRGLHYPRHFRTASDAKTTYEPFLARFPSVYKEVTQYYAISKSRSKVSGDEYEDFANQLGVDVEAVRRHPLIPEEDVGVILKVRESTFDIDALREQISREIALESRIQLLLRCNVSSISEKSSSVKVVSSLGSEFVFDQVFVCTYAMNRTFAEMLDLDFYPTKYQVCEVLLGKAPQLINEGLTIMDGPFWSIMPFGFTGLHSLTHVSHTPLAESEDGLLSCQTKHQKCGKDSTFHCSKCEFLPISKRQLILDEVSEFTKGKLSFVYEKSLFTLKAVLNDRLMDGRPTMVRKTSSGKVVFIFSGKVGDIANLDHLLS